MAHDRDVLNDGFIDDTFDDINPRETEGFKLICIKGQKLPLVVAHNILHIICSALYVLILSEPQGHLSRFFRNQRG